MTTRELTKAIYKRVADKKVWHRNKDGDSGTWVIPIIQLRAVLDEVIAEDKAEKKGAKK